MDIMMAEKYRDIFAFEVYFEINQHDLPSHRLDLGDGREERIRDYTEQSPLLILINRCHLLRGKIRIEHTFQKGRTKKSSM